MLKIDQFGGIDDHWVAPLGSASVAVNLRWDPVGAWMRSGGAVSAGTFTTLSNVQSIGYFAQHEGARQWVPFEAYDSGESSVVLAVVDRGSYTVLETGRELTYGGQMRTQYIAAGNWMYVFNGRDAPVRWDGTELVPVGFDRVPVGLEAEFLDERDLWSDEWDSTTVYTETNGRLQRGLGGTVESGAADIQWAYVYAFQWLNDQGWSSPMSARTVVRGRNTDAGKTAAIIRMPDGPPHARGFRLLRSSNVSDITLTNLEHVRLYRHSEYHHAFACRFIDNLPDAELGAQVSDVELLPTPNGRMAAVWKHHLFVVVDDILHFSSPLRLEEFPIANRIRVGSRNAGEITGLFATRNALIVFKRRGIYMVRGEPGSLSVQTLTESAGCTSPNAIVEVPRLGVMFLDEDGPKVLAGSPDEGGPIAQVLEVGAGIQRLWRRRVTRGALLGATAVVNTREREVWFQVAVDGSQNPSFGLVYHYDRSAWTTREGFPAACLAVTQDHRSLVFFGSNDDDHRGVFAYSTGVLDMDGDALSSEWVSTWMTPGDRHASFQPNRVNLYVLGHGRDLTVNHKANHRVAYDLSTPETQGAYDTDVGGGTGSGFIWGEAKWDSTAVWGDLAPVPVPVDVQVGDGACRELVVKLGGDRLGLIGMNVEIASVDPKNRAPNERSGGRR